MNQHRYALRFHTPYKVKAHVTSSCCLGNRAGVYGSHSAGCKAGDPGGRPLPAGTCHHVQASSKVSERGGREGGRGEKRYGRRRGRGGRREGRRRGRGGRRGWKVEKKNCCSFIEHL